MVNEAALASASTVVPAQAGAKVLLTCEHASNALPSGYSWPASDRWLAQAHWAWDIGAAVLTRQLASTLLAPAVIANHSRLLVDLNRQLHEDTLFRDLADSKTVALNAEIGEQDRENRLKLYYYPYYETVRRVAKECAVDILFSVHTFTPVYEEERRELEVGVLYDTEEKLGHLLVEHLSGEGFFTRPNEPYSGREGLMYCVQHNADSVGARALEVEVRQDLAVDPLFRQNFANAMASFFSSVTSS